MRSKYLVEVTGFLFVDAVVGDVHFHFLAYIPLVEDVYLRGVWNVICDELDGNRVVFININLSVTPSGCCTLSAIPKT